MITLYGIPNCDTVKKARAWLDARGIEFGFHDFKKMGVEADMLERWADAASWELLLNTRGTTFRKLADTDKQDIDRAKALRLLEANPSMIKRPVVEDSASGMVTVGFKPEQFAAEWA